MKSVFIASVFVACISPGFAQSGPAQLPADGGKNVLLPTLERPDSGWPDRSEWPSWSEYCAPGLPANFRISKITGDRSVFDAAQVRHQEWYSKYGYTDSRIIPLPIVLPDLNAGVIASQDEVTISLAVLGAEGDVPVNDFRREDSQAAKEWTDFVKDYADNSVVIESAWTCVSREFAAVQGQ